MTAVNPHLLGDREAMGLPDGCTGRLDFAKVQHEARGMALRSQAELVKFLEDPDLDFETRYAAGSLLALVGDPRLDPDAPEMVEIPAADVLMGTEPAEVAKVAEAWSSVGVQEDWIAKETPRHRRHVERFLIAVRPVTNAEYEVFVRQTGRAAPSSWRFGVYPHHLANHPVWTVTPEDADAYAQWLSRRTGRRFRLPTEAEWEYAASGGDGRQFPWGDDWDAGLANTVESGPLGTTPVGCYPGGRSPFGLQDVAGNVEEYTSDTYRPYPGGEHVEDDLVTSQGGYRITRGGSFTRYGDLTRCARRHGWYPRDIYAVGFRLAETPGAQA